MKTLAIYASLIALSVTSLSAFPNDEHHPDAKPPTAPMAQAAPAPAKPTTNETGMDKRMAQMQENMKKMQSQMEKIRQTADPKERQRLLEEHMQTMQAQMKNMQGMGGGMMQGMMGGNMQGGMPGDGMMMGRDPKGRGEMTEKRMDMMQMMMEQMMQHQGAQAPASAK